MAASQRVRRVAVAILAAEAALIIGFLAVYKPFDLDILARRGDWLGAAAVAGVTGLIVCPISWTHHWVWVAPALVVLLRGGHGWHPGHCAPSGLPAR